MKGIGFLLSFILLSFSCFSQSDTIPLPAVATSSFSVNGVEIKMVKVERGSFWMGAQKSDTLEFNYNPYAQPDEYPVHHVVISKDFLIGESEVTQKLWKAVMGENPSIKCRKRRPVNNITWYEAMAFIDSLNKITHLDFRLPTEEEWEYAARGGKYSRNHIYSGADDYKKSFWCFENSRHAKRTCRGVANELGIYDMSGNVYEWCQTRYGYYDGERKEPAQGKVPLYVIRGGCWSFPAKDARVSWRGKRFANAKAPYGGFRLCLDARHAQEQTVPEEKPKK